MPLAKLLNVMNKHRTVLLLFAISTTFFVYQHTTGISWDFAAYVLNAKYWLGGSYFEWLRPPLTSFMLLLFSALGWPAAEYAFIVFTSALFLAACIKFSKAFNVNATLLYAFMLTPLVLNMGFSDGSELLGLSLLMLAVSYFYICSNTLKSGALFGIFMGLTFLCRYNNIVFLPVVFFKKPKKEMLKEIFVSIAIALGSFLLVLMPWLVYNQVVTGSWVTSIVDLYAINMKFREYMRTLPNAFEILAAFSYYLPFFILGIMCKFKKAIGLNNLPKDLSLLFVFAVVLLSYIFTPTKTIRYLFNLTLPVVYFSTYFFQFCFPKFQKIEEKLTFLIVALNLLFATTFFLPFFDSSMYKQLADSLENCKLQSNVWVFLNYYGKLAEPHPWDSQVAKEIAAGNRLLLFKKLVEPAYSRDEVFLLQFPVIEDNADYILLGNSSVCRPPEPYTKTYLQHYIENNEMVDSISNCEIFLPQGICNSYSFLKKLFG